MRNAVGEGPAATAEISTPPEVSGIYNSWSIF